MNRLKLVLVTILSTTIAGCGTSIKSKRISNTPSKGIVYALPFTTFTGSVNYRPISCSADKIEIATTINAKSNVKIDKDNVYTVSPKSISKFWNTTSFNVEMYENTLSLKSINTSVEDQVIPLAKTIISTGFSIASGNIAAAIPPPGASSLKTHCEDNFDIKFSCTSEVKNGLNSISSAKSNLEIETNKLKQLSRELVILNAEIADLGDNVGQTKKKELAELKTKVRTRNGVVADAQKKLDSSISLITKSTNFEFPDDSFIFESTVFKLSPETAKNWVDVSYTFNGCNNFGLQKVATLTSEEGVLAAVSEKLKLPEQALKLKIEGADDYSVNNMDFGKCTKLEDEAKAVHLKRCLERKQDSNGGIFYRNPRPGVLVADYVNVKDKKETIFSGEIHQLGFVNSLEFSTRALESAKANASFSDKGYVTSYGYEQTKSVNESVNDLIDSVSTDYSAYREAKLAAPQKALDAELAQLEAQKSILDARAALSSEAQEIQLINQEIAKINAEKARLEAQKALEALNK